MSGTETHKAFIPWLIVLGLWAVIHGTLAATVASPVFDGVLPGPDEYMRLVRVAELRDGGGWYDSVIERSNAPYGDLLHWTRPMDILILGLAAPLSLFVGADSALYAAGAVVSPLLALLTCFVVAWAVRPVLGRDRSLLAVFVFLIQPAVLAYSAAGRADHHALLFLAFTFAVGGAIRLLGAKPSVRDALLAGSACGLAIWVSVELTLLVALCQATAAIAWVRTRGISARMQLVASAAFLAAIFAALLIEVPSNRLLAVVYDRLSLPYALIAALTMAVWSAASLWEVGHADSATPRRRLLLIGTTAGLGLACLLALYPGFLAGPYAAIDPRLLPIWHDHVAERAPLFPDTIDHTGRFLFFIGTAALSLPYAIAVAWRRRTESEALYWPFLAIVLAVYFLISLAYIRAAAFAEIAAVPVIADMIARLIAWCERKLGMLVRLAVICTACFGLMFGSLLAGNYLLLLAANAAPAMTAPECRISKIAPILADPNGLGARPLVIAALLDHGPEILYRTPHSVISAPYHRNAAGIWESHRLLATQDEAESRAVIARRGIDLLILCPSFAEQRFYKYEPGSVSLYARLLKGDAPDWLAPIPLDTKRADGFLLYRVLR